MKVSGVFLFKSSDEQPFEDFFRSQKGSCRTPVAIGDGYLPSNFCDMLLKIDDVGLPFFHLHLFFQAPSLT